MVVLRRKKDTAFYYNSIDCAFPSASRISFNKLFYSSEEYMDDLRYIQKE